MGIFELPLFFWLLAGKFSLRLGCLQIFSLVFRFAFALLFPGSLSPSSALPLLLNLFTLLSIYCFLVIFCLLIIFVLPLWTLNHVLLLWPSSLWSLLLLIIIFLSLLSLHFIHPLLLGCLSRSILRPVWFGVPIRMVLIFGSLCLGPRLVTLRRLVLRHLLAVELLRWRFLLVDFLWVMKFLSVGIVLSFRWHLI